MRNSPRNIGRNTVEILRETPQRPFFKYREELWKQSLRKTGASRKKRAGSIFVVLGGSTGENLRGNPRDASENSVEETSERTFPRISQKSREKLLEINPRQPLKGNF